MTGKDTPQAREDAAGHPLELALRYGLRYSGLREVRIDSRLLAYVPLDVCERLQIAPIAVGDDVLELATAFAEPDLELFEARFPGLEIELVLAPIERIAALHDELRGAIR